jgi:amino acid transporter
MDTIATIFAFTSAIIAVFFFIGFSYNYYDENKEKVNDKIYIIIGIIIVILFFVFLEYISTN